MWGFKKHFIPVAEAALAVYYAANKQTERQDLTTMPPFEQFVEFANNHALLSVGVVGSALLLIFTEIQKKARAISDISPQAAVAIMNQKAKVLDLRSPELFQRGHLVGAKNVLPSDLSPDSAAVSNLGDQPVLFVCDTGMQSSKLAATLRKKAGLNSFSLKGGLSAWQQENLPLVGGKKEKLPKSKRKKDKQVKDK